jgi:hypothetical protein
VTEKSLAPGAGATACLPVGASFGSMLRQGSVARLQADLGALEASAERARAALGCIYSSSNEFEAAAIRARQAVNLWGPRTIGTMRLVLGATMLAALAALAALAV